MGGSSEYFSACIWRMMNTSPHPLTRSCMQPYDLMSIDLIPMHTAPFSERKGCPIVGIIVHSMGSGFLESLNTLTGEVSAHYFVPQLTGRELQQQYPGFFAHVEIQYPDRVPVIQLVPTDQCAWHAGVSTFSNWNTLPVCETGLNACTIGIEFHTPGYGEGRNWYCFSTLTPQQTETGIALVQMLQQHYQIPSTHFLAHSTIAVGRKTDPGPLFPWQAFSEAGIGPRGAVSSPSLAEADGVLAVQHRLRQLGFVACPPTGGGGGATGGPLDGLFLPFSGHPW